MTFTPNSYRKTIHFYELGIVAGILLLVIPQVIPFYLFSILALSPYIWLRLTQEPREYRVLLIDDNNPLNTLKNTVTTGSNMVNYHNDVNMALQYLNACPPEEFPDYIIIDLKYQDEMVKEFIQLYNHDLKEKHPNTQIHLINEYQMTN